MKKLSEDLLLYHGSYCIVEHPDLNKCSGNKDFGKGFYLTSSRQQAENFLKTSLGKAKTAGVISSDQDYGFISSYKFQRNDALRVKLFPSADSEWLHCVAAHRRNEFFKEIREKLNEYDVIVGKIADDQTNATLLVYLSGAFGSIGTLEADEFCIKRLLPDKLKDQYCFKTEAAINALTFLGSEQIWLKK